MDTVRLSLQGAWALLYTGLFLGAGLPILFALGVRFLAGQEMAAVDGETVSTPSNNPSGPGVLPRLLAGLCFALVLLGVITGIMIIIGAGMGKVVVFDHIYPTLEPKP